MNLNRVGGLGKTQSHADLPRPVADSDQPKLFATTTDMLKTFYAPEQSYNFYNRDSTDHLLRKTSAARLSSDGTRKLERTESAAEVITRPKRTQKKPIPLA